ncbi:MAG TPA: hypothetical protein VG102_01735 [Candidatus Paceibacterota bacterium]|nr:hypothetical protein [Candidatus Paceibacterota bacterium]
MDIFLKILWFICRPFWYLIKRIASGVVDLFVGHASRLIYAILALAVAGFFFTYIK